MTLSIANHAASLPVTYRLYLPQEWADDAARRSKAHVPEDVIFETKPHIALNQMKAALAAGVPRGVVLADAAYGTNGAFRAALTQSGLSYAVGVQSNVAVWPPGVDPLPAMDWSGRRRRPTRPRRDAEHQPVSVEQLGAHVLYLPAYSPDFNPIDKLFSKFKAILQRLAARTAEALEAAVAEALRSVTPDECRNYFAACGYDAV